MRGIHGSEGEGKSKRRRSALALDEMRPGQRGVCPVRKKRQDLSTLKATEHQIDVSLHRRKTRPPDLPLNPENEIRSRSGQVVSCWVTDRYRCSWWCSGGSDEPDVTQWEDGFTEETIDASWDDLIDVRGRQGRGRLGC